MIELLESLGCEVLPSPSTGFIRSAEASTAVPWTSAATGAAIVFPVPRRRLTIALNFVRAIC